MTGSFAIACTMNKMKPSWNWVARRLVHDRPDSATARSTASCEAEHRPVHAADHRDPVRPDHRDVQQVAHPRPLRSPHQVSRLRNVFLHPWAAGAVHDDLGPLDRSVDALVLRQVADDVFDAVRGVVGAPAEHAHFPPGLAKPRGYPPAQPR
jgi:hypothetical protein